MTNEEKQLLLKDLCARLPYGFTVHRYSDNRDITFGKNELDEFSHFLEYSEGEEFKPYLRPMSSMTKEETEEYKQFLEDIEGYAYSIDCVPQIDWLNAHHFDYRGLIEKGLALETPEEESEKGSEIPIPKTVDEAVKTLAKIVSKEDRDYLLENGAISMHDSMGRWIRNEWGLWTDSELKNELKKKGFEHPDDMSNYIIEEFIKYLT